VSDLARRIQAAVEAIQLVDTHEHLFAEDERHRAAVDFGYLFPHYASSDLVSAGLPPALLEAVRLPSLPAMMERWRRMRRARYFPTPPRTDMSLEERWEVLAPYWECIRSTGYGTCLRIAIRDLFGVADLSGQTIRELSDAIADSRRPGWYQHVLKERARIAVSIQDDGRATVDKSFFVPASAWNISRWRARGRRCRLSKGSAPLPSTRWTRS